MSAADSRFTAEPARDVNLLAETSVPPHKKLAVLVFCPYSDSFQAVPLDSTAAAG